MSSLQQLPTLSLELAQRGLDAATSHAQNKLHIPVNVSIYSASLHLLAFGCMDGAKLTSIDIAHNKAFTAAGHKAPTSVYDAKRVGPGGPLFGVQHSNDGRFATIAGGVPVMVDGRCVGAIGVSGGLPSQDEVSSNDGWMRASSGSPLISLQEIAEKGVQAILAALPPKAKL